MLTEIWIRPTITYGLVACFVSEGGGEGNGLTVSEEIAAKEKKIGVDNATPISYYLTL